MRKKHVDARSVLPVRGRTVDRKLDVTMLVSEQTVPDSPTDRHSSQQYPNYFDPVSMYHFGFPSSTASNPPNYDFLLPYSVPTMQFPAPPPGTPDENEVPQPHLLYSFICEELHKDGVRFDGQVHPFMHDLISDENGQPLATSAEAEPDFVPVYPQWQPPSFHPPIAQAWPPQNPFVSVERPPHDLEQSRRRITPVSINKAPRKLVPKGKLLPPAAPVDTLDVGERNRTPGRKRPLSPDARIATREVRIMHACARCRVTRERCGTTRPCKPCMGEKRRSLDLPCMQELPENRGSHFFTNTMIGHFKLNKVKEAMPNPIPGKQPFTIRLHQYFDDPELDIIVTTFEPQTRNDVRKSVFPIGRGETGFLVLETQIISPPLVPAFKDDRSYALFRKRFYWSVRRWLEQAEVHDNEHVGWHQVYFREEYGKAWPRAILGDICTFYHGVTRSGCPVLKSVLHTSVLVYMMGHSFYIPHEDVDEVLKKTFGLEFSGEPTEWVSPIYVDRFLKSLLLPVYQGAIKASLRGIQSLYSPAKPSEFVRDRILAASIVLLIIAGSQQSKAIEKALAQHTQGHEVDRIEVFAQIQEIEKYIVDLVLELWTYKFNSNARMGRDEPEDRFKADRAKDFDLLERFRASYLNSAEDAESLRDLPTDLPSNIDSQRFGTNNIERILKKFYMCVFPQSKSRCVPER